MITIPCGDWVGGETVTGKDIALVGTRTVVRFRDITPKDRIQQAQVALALTKEKLISMETAREDYLGLENPTQENQRVINSLIYQDPGIMKELMVPLSLYHNDPELFEIWATMMVNKLREQIQQQQEQQMQQAQQASAAAAGSIPGAAGMPPVPGMPPTPAPAPMGPIPFDGMAHAQASSQGAAGMLRQPGMPQAPIPW